MPNLALHSNFYYSVSYVLIISKYKTHKEVRNYLRIEVSKLQYMSIQKLLSLIVNIMTPIQIRSQYGVPLLAE